MFGAKWVDAIKNQGEWWRFFTAMFLHGGLGKREYSLKMMTYFTQSHMLQYMLRLT